MKHRRMQIDLCFVRIMWIIYSWSIANLKLIYHLKKKKIHQRRLMTWYVVTSHVQWKGFEILLVFTWHSCTMKWGINLQNNHEKLKYGEIGDARLLPNSDGRIVLLITCVVWFKQSTMWVIERRHPSKPNDVMMTLWWRPPVTFSTRPDHSPFGDDHDVISRTPSKRRH